MSNRLKSIFEYQKFEMNPKMSALIADTESRYFKESLSDDELEMVVAAGDPSFIKKPVTDKGIQTK